MPELPEVTTTPVVKNNFKSKLFFTTGREEVLFLLNNLYNLDTYA